MTFYQWLNAYKNTTKKEYKTFHETKRKALKMEFMNFEEYQEEQEDGYQLLADIGVPFFDGEPLGIG